MEFGVHSGPWRGFYLDPRQPGRHGMRVSLTFHGGRILGDGIDDVGTFTIEGRYTVESRECTWSKRYATHEVVYRGFAEGDSIWGVWRIRDTSLRGGFRLWPVASSEGMATRAEVHADIGST